LTRYAVDPTATLLPDFFLGKPPKTLPGRVKATQPKVEQVSTVVSAAAATDPTAPAANPATSPAKDGEKAPASVTQTEPVAPPAVVGGVTAGETKPAITVEPAQAIAPTPADASETRGETQPKS
jgi:hypothetical protein